MKTVVITGTSSGIGKALALSLLQKDFKVYGISRSNPQIDNPMFFWIQMDLTNYQEISLLKDKIAEEHIDILINNAGIAFEKPALEFSSVSFDQIFDLNFKAPIIVSQQLISKLQNGLIINISSISDRIPGEGFALYCASKAALNVYFDATAMEHKELKVINILPDYVDTPLLRKLQNNAPFDWNQTIKPKQIADFVVSIIENNVSIPSSSRIIIINNALKEDLDYKEVLWAYNTDTKKLEKLS